MRRLLLLRHGRTESNERRLFTGQTDIGLSADGADALAARRHLYPQGARYFTSGMRRTEETLAVLYGDVPHTAIPALAEYCFGDFEGRSHADLYENEPQYRAWLDVTRVDIACPGGETRRAFGERVREGWASLLGHQWDDLAVLIAHGGVIRTLMNELCPREEPYTSTENGGGWVLTLDASGQVIACEAFV